MFDSINAMQFFVFITLFFAISLFHRQEHLWFIAELRALQKKLAAATASEAGVKESLKGEDWRLVALAASQLSLRRAFHVGNAKAAARYATPILLLCITLLWLQSWVLAGGYAALLAVKWFASVTVLDIGPAAARYEVRLFGRKLFGESL